MKYLLAELVGDRGTSAANGATALALVSPCGQGSAARAVAIVFRLLCKLSDKDIGPTSTTFSNGCLGSSTCEGRSEAR